MVVAGRQAGHTAASGDLEERMLIVVHRHRPLVGMSRIVGEQDVGLPPAFAARHREREQAAVQLLPGGFAALGDNRAAVQIEGARAYVSLRVMNEPDLAVAVEIDDQLWDAERHKVVGGFEEVQGESPPQHLFSRRETRQLRRVEAVDLDRCRARPRQIERHQEALALVAVAVHVHALSGVRAALRVLEDCEVLARNDRERVGPLLSLGGCRHTRDDQRATVRGPKRADRASLDTQHRGRGVGGPHHIRVSDAVDERRQRPPLGGERVDARTAVPGQGRNGDVEELGQAVDGCHERREVERDEQVPVAVRGGEQLAAHPLSGELVGRRQGDERWELVVRCGGARDEQRVDQRRTDRRRARRQLDRNRAGEGPPVADGSHAIVGVGEVEAHAAGRGAVGVGEWHGDDHDGRATGNAEGNGDVVVGHGRGEHVRRPFDCDRIARPGERRAHLAEGRHEDALGGGDHVAGRVRWRRTEGRQHYKSYEDVPLHGSEASVLPWGPGLSLPLRPTVKGKCLPVGREPVVCRR